MSEIISQPHRKFPLGNFVLNFLMYLSFLALFEAAVNYLWFHESFWRRLPFDVMFSLVFAWQFPRGLLGRLKQRVSSHS